jgi:DNA-binding transcriptional ArsR family regulator
MTRRTADQRYSDLPSPAPGPPEGDALPATVAALSHPSRRLLLDYLGTHGPAPVGRLARATGLAPGSVSHHIRVLARVGLVAPAPELAGDTRESWWRHVPRSVTWDATAFGDGPAAEQLAQAASDANLSYLLDAVRRWRAAPPTPGWDAVVTDTLVLATSDELDDLATRMAELVAEWKRGCLARADAERARSADAAPQHPVRVIALGFPEEGHRA